MAAEEGGAPGAGRSGGWRRALRQFLGRVPAATPIITLGTVPGISHGIDPLPAGGGAAAGRSDHPPPRLPDAPAPGRSAPNRWAGALPNRLGRRGESAFGSLFDAVPCPAALIDAGNTVTALNPALRALLGPALAVAPMPAEQLFDPAARAAARQWLAAGGSATLEAALAAPVGSRPPEAACTLRPLLRGNRVLLIEDLSERRRFRERAEEGERLRAVGQLAGGIAHDFNNLLAIIVAATEETRERLLTEEAQGAEGLAQGGGQGVAQRGGQEVARKSTQELTQGLAQGLEPVLAAADRGAALVGRLLALAGRQHLEPRVLVLDEAIEGMRALLRPLLGRGVQLVLEPNAPGRRALVDPVQLDQVVLNLARNARQAMGARGQLRIATESAVAIREEPGEPDPLPPGRWTVISVADSGPGIPPELLGRIFEPFFTTRGEEGGTGLGLATVHGIVRQSGGALQVTSQPGEGTTFRIFLPRHQGEAPAAAEAPAVTPLPSAAPIRVLLAEDEALLRRLAAGALEAAGMEVRAAEGGEEALDELFAGFVPDVLVSDVAMPGMDGVTLLREVRLRHPDLPVILVSGYAEAALDGGALEPQVRFVTKPYRPRELVEQIRAAVSQPVQENG
ncbi:ATP-binding protein [Roseomonas elaeocarpi]|uniref:histidine kinase n=1 Tax=Roseomonas elaeocarpi TaxID=907779 RepID=A0ABV6JS17_9PROT